MFNHKHKLLCVCGHIFVSHTIFLRLSFLLFLCSSVYVKLESGISTLSPLGFMITYVLLQKVVYGVGL